MSQKSLKFSNRNQVTAINFYNITTIMLSKQLWRSFAARNKIVNGLLKHNEKKTQSSLIVTRNMSNKHDNIDAELNKPVKYTTSPANDWKAQHSRIGSKAEFGPWYEPHIVSASLILFMVYFFILREENDLDLMLDKPLSETLKND